MNTNETIYCDMDGVLARFDDEPNAVERFKTERGFFNKLKCYRKNVAALRKVIKNYPDLVYILTASPNPQADSDKIKWLKRYFPTLDMSHIIICRLGKRKVDYMKTKNGVLFDDYSRNINEWMTNANNGAFQIKADGDISHFINLMETY